MKRMTERLRATEKEIRPFTEEDAFNQNRKLEGWICIKDGPYYGALLLTRIGDEPTEQWVFGTPKLDYPFDRNGNWHFPRATDVLVYDKLDGTNIVAYAYNHGGRRFVTYKTRLTPVVRNSGRFGPFRDMLNEVLPKYRATIETIVRTRGWNLSFELYGARNKHLMIYTLPLDLCLLFKINQLTGEIVPPLPSPDDALLPRPLCYPFPPGGNYVETYQWHQREDEQRLAKTDLGYEGSEGRVWYMKLETGRWIMAKCKPESIEAIHWAAGLSKNIIRATAYNVLENHPEIDFARIKELLLETHAEKEIDDRRDIIEEVIAEIRKDLEFEQQVLDEYRKIGIDIRTDKGAVMRAMAQKFSKERIRWVYFVLANKVTS